MSIRGIYSPEGDVISIEKRSGEVPHNSIENPLSFAPTFNSTVSYSMPSFINPKKCLLAFPSFPTPITVALPGILDFSDIHMPVVPLPSCAYCEVSIVMHITMGFPT